MPVASSDIQYRLSGGASNANAEASLGGAMSATAVPAGLFGDIKSDEALAGRVEYRCYYIRNSHTTLTALDVKLWMHSNTPLPETTVALGLGSAAIGATEQVVDNDVTAPAGVSFSAAANEAGALSIGSLAPGQGKSVWARLTVNPGTPGPVADPFTPRVKLDTQP